MMQDEKFIKSYDGELLYAKEYVTENPKGTIIITHDEKEHSGLYGDFAKDLTNFGYNVFTYDLRAHKNSAKEPFGTYSGNFFNDSVRDLLYLNKYLSKKYNTKIVNIGIGLGGVIITRMLQFNHAETTDILIGTPFSNLNLSNYFYLCWTRLILVFVNKNSQAKTVNKLINNNLTHRFEDKAYQSTNKEYIEKIRNDKFCNFDMSSNMINSIMKGRIQTFSRKNLQKIENCHKILLCSGQYDVVTNFSKSTHKLAIKMAKSNIEIEKIVFKNFRHNLLNESNNTFAQYLKDYLLKGENYD